MISAYLEDFYDIKLILDSSITFNSFEIYALYNNQKIKLTINNVESLVDKNYVYLKSTVLIEPFYETFIIFDKQKVFLQLGKITRSPLFEQMYFFNDWLGFQYHEEYTIFRLWSPVCKQVRIIINQKVYDLKYQKQGLWEIKINQNLDKALYYYEIRINQHFEKVLDPYALASNANHQANYVIDFKKTYQMKYHYFNQENFKSNQAIIYEMSIRDATSLCNVENPGTYNALTESSDKDYALGYIRNLGITHLQLMPFYAFGGVDEEITHQESVGFLYNWGYNPMQYMVPSGYYSISPNDPYARINELKALIDEIHHLKMGINMDVVYNHVYNSNWFPLEKLVPGYCFRTDEQGFLTNSSWCGNDLCTNHLMVRKLIIDSIKIFQNEYKIDGFRFDLMGLIDIDTINEIQKTTSAINPLSMIYGEGWNMDVKLPISKRANMNNAKKMPSISFFNDHFRNILKEEYLLGEMIDDDLILDLLKGNHPLFIFPSQSINYLECHDNYTLYDNIKIKTSFNEQEIDDMIRLGLSLNVLSQGICFIHSAMEKRRTKQFIDNSYNLNDQINGINWYSEINFSKTLIDLIKIKKKYPVFNLDDKIKIDQYIKLENDKNLLIIRYNNYQNESLQMIISNNYEEKRKIFSPGTRLIFDGEKEVDEKIEVFVCKKPGVYLFIK